MHLIDIAKSWYDLATAPQSFREMAEKRLNICDGCTEKRIMNSLGQYIVTAINSQASIYVCGACSCPLASKTINKQSVCPLGKW